MIGAIMFVHSVSVIVIADNGQFNDLIIVLMRSWKTPWPRINLMRTLSLNFTTIFLHSCHLEFSVVIWGKHDAKISMRFIRMTMGCHLMPTIIIVHCELKVSIKYTILPSNIQVTLIVYVIPVAFFWIISI